MLRTPTTLLLLLLCLTLLSACATRSTPRTELQTVSAEIPLELKTCGAGTRPPQMTTQRQLATWLTPEVIDGWACRLGVERLDDVH